MVFARKPDTTWRICYDYSDRGFNAISRRRPAVEPLPHIDALLDGTQGSCFFTKLDLAKLWVRASDPGSVDSGAGWKTRFRSQLGQFE